MQCGLIQELIDAHKIMDQFNSLNDVIISQSDQQLTVKDWFLRHPSVMKQLRLTPNKMTYQLVDRRINQIMADLF